MSIMKTLGVTGQSRFVNTLFPSPRATSGLAVTTEAASNTSAKVMKRMIAIEAQFEPEKSRLVSKLSYKEQLSRKLRGREKTKLTRSSGSFKI